MQNNVLSMTYCEHVAPHERQQSIREPHIDYCTLCCHSWGAATWSQYVLLMTECRPIIFHFYYMLKKFDMFVR